METKLYVQGASAAISCIFLVLAIFRLPHLRGESVKVVPNRRGQFKLGCVLVLFGAQLGLFAFLLGSSSRERFFNVEILSTAVSLRVFAALCPLVYLEHSRSIRPSDLLVLYLLASLVCDVAELVGVEKPDSGNTLRIQVTLLAQLGRLFAKILLLVAESRGKESILKHSLVLQDDDYRHDASPWPPEQLAGVLSRTFFWWINPLLAKGGRYILGNNDIPALIHELSARQLRYHALMEWDRRSRPETQTTLPKVLARSMVSHFFAPVIPRLFLIGFRYSQPVLIGKAIRYLGESQIERPWPEDAALINWNSGSTLILGAAFAFVGLAVSEVVYRTRLNRLRLMIRGAVIGLINNKSFVQVSGGGGVTYGSDGRAITLIGTDAEGVGNSAGFFHETWAQFVEVIIGTSMLASHVGWACLVPLVIIVFCSRMSKYLAKNLQQKQKDWSVATQKRLAMTTSMLTSIKTVKMLGLQSRIEALLLSLRAQEMRTANKVRWMMVAYNASANALGIFSPIVTFVLFVLIARALQGASFLDAETAFTTTALLGLVAHPANMIMSIVPQAVGSLAAFSRIQAYLTEPPRQDSRVVLARVQGNSRPGTPGMDPETDEAFCFKNVTIKPQSNKSSSASAVLQNINMSARKGSVVVCSGPVASGKTSLAKVLLGELAPAAGTVFVASTHIGYCEQLPWLPSGTIRDAICGFKGNQDPTWYRKVVQLCCLDQDISSLPDADDAMIGSRGFNLSGGQKERLALARAIYARCDIVILDDSFSALDGTTESRILKNLFGPDGHFKQSGTTVLLITNSGTYFPLADHIVLLGEGTISYQGSWSDYQATQHHRPQDVVQKLQTGLGSEPEARLQAEENIKSRNLQIAEALSDLNRATGDLSLYSYYMKFVGLRNLLLLAFCTASYSVFITTPQYWLQRWTEAPASQTNFYIGGYLILSLFAWTATNGSMWSTHILIAPGSGVKLHRRLLRIIMGAPLAFFSATDTGVVLNRFSQDMNLIDRQLPPAVLALLNQIFKLLVQAALLFSAQRLLTWTLPLCIVTVYFVQRIYLRTSRQLRLLDLESQSGLYSSFLETIDGLMTIRAFGWQKQVEYINIRSLDESQKPFYILLCLQQWLGLVLDLMVAALATGLIALAVLVKGTTTGAQIGMALNIVLVANGTLLSLVASWTDLETSLGAISRLKTLEIETHQEEGPADDYIPPDTWPSKGKVEIEHVSVSYGSHDALALQDVSLSIHPGQQVFICGRTGSGKSTFLLALLRLVDLKSGRIKVDGVDLNLVPRSVIRQRCFVTVSQDPFLVGQESLRFNLDPSASLPDHVIISALQKTDLWHHFKGGQGTSTPGSISPTQHELYDQRPITATATARNMSRQHGNSKILNTPMNELPHLSAGQTQIFALARAILQSEALTSQSMAAANEESSTALYDEREGESTPLILGNGNGNAGRTTGQPKPKPIILLDEATSLLDRVTESSIRRIIRREFMEMGYTVIAITHRVGIEIMHAGDGDNSNVGDMDRQAGDEERTRTRTRVVLLAEGRVERFGSVDEVFGSSFTSGNGFKD